jgi:hypothetical protein
MSQEFDTLEAQQQSSAADLESAQQQAAPPAQEQEAVLWNVEALRPGDYALLAQVLAAHPELHDQIIERAAAFVGNDTIAKALQFMAGEREPEAPSEKASDAGAPSEEQTDFDYTTSPLAIEYDRDAKVKDHVDYIRAHPELGDAVLAGAAEIDPALAVEVAAALKKSEDQPAAEVEQEETPPQVIQESAEQAIEATPAAQPEQMAAPAPVTAEEAVEVQPAAAPEKESGWVSRARAYNQWHVYEVASFLAATGNACMVDGVLDPNLVAKWQEEHGVAVDGRIGNDTVEAASRAQPTTIAEVKEAEAEENPEDDPTDPRNAL